MKHTHDATDKSNLRLALDAMKVPTPPRRSWLGSQSNTEVGFKGEARPSVTAPCWPGAEQENMDSYYMDNCEILHFWFNFRGFFLKEMVKKCKSKKIQQKKCV